MRHYLMLLLTIAAVSLTAPASAQPSKANAKQLQLLLKRYPQADANQDGKLTAKEALAFQQKTKAATKNRKSAKPNKAPAPTFENVQYGPYERNVFDIWLPDSKKTTAPKSPTALIVFIHGGGFVGGSKNQVRSTPLVQQALDHGVAFASIQYRFIHKTDDLNDPQRAGIQNVLRDSARAIQFMRSKAADYNLDKRIITYGGSAGAGTSIWLAFHDDLADPTSADPVLRESSRLSAAGMIAGQFTYDVEQWDDYFKGGDIHKTHGEGTSQDRNFGRFFGIDDKTYLSPAGQKWRADVDMHNLITPDDPPIYAITNNPDVAPNTRGIYNHHPRHAQLIEERCRVQGVKVLCLVPKVRSADAAQLNANPDLMMDFFFEQLDGATAQ